MPSHAPTPVKVAAVGVLFVAVVAGGVAAARDSRLDLCPTVRNKVLASFEIAQARRYQEFIPEMLRSPELETDSSAYVVIFDGPATLDVAGAPPGVDDNGAVISEEPAPAAYDGVVCVVVDGTPTVYVNVDLAGWHRPG